MKVNKSVILVLGVIAALLIATFFFAKMEFFKGRAPAQLPPPTEEKDLVVKGEGLNYAIPSNAVPTVQDIEVNIKKAQDERRAAGERSAKARRGRVKEGEVPPAPRQAQVPPAAKEKEAGLPERKEVVFPTWKEREGSESKGIITY